MLIQISKNNELAQEGGEYPRHSAASEIGIPPGSFALETDLRAIVRGEVRFDDGSRALYSTDASNYRQVPIGVVLPREKEDVIRTIAVCRRHEAPVLNRGGGTSLAGQCCNMAVVVDMSKYMRSVLAVDSDKKLGRVEPGCVLDDFRNATEKHGLIFGPDPATHNRCTLGGMVGNNSRGRKGEIYRQLASLRDRYADEIRKRFPKSPRLVSGYPINELLPEDGFHVARALVGTESTCVTVLEIEGNLVPNPPVRNLPILGYPDVYQAGDHVSEEANSVMKAQVIFAQTQICSSHSRAVRKITDSLLWPTHDDDRQTLYACRSQTRRTVWQAQVRKLPKAKLQTAIQDHVNPRRNTEGQQKTRIRVTWAKIVTNGKSLSSLIPIGKPEKAVMARQKEIGSVRKWKSPEALVLKANSFALADGARELSLAVAGF